MNTFTTNDELEVDTEIEKSVSKTLARYFEPVFRKPIPAVELDRERLCQLYEIESIMRRRAEARLEKADHDRKRYARRIKLLQDHQMLLSRDYNALRLENDILRKALEACERRLLYVEGGTQEGGTGTEECEQACSSGSGPEAGNGHQENGNL